MEAKNERREKRGIFTPTQASCVDLLHCACCVGQCAHCFCTAKTGHCRKMILFIFLCWPIGPVINFCLTGQQAKTREKAFSAAHSKISKILKFKKTEQLSAQSSEGDTDWTLFSQKNKTTNTKRSNPQILDPRLRWARSHFSPLGYLMSGNAKQPKSDLFSNEPESCPASWNGSLSRLPSKMRLGIDRKLARSLSATSACQQQTLSARRVQVPPA